MRESYPMTSQKSPQQVSSEPLVNHDLGPEDRGKTGEIRWERKGGVEGREKKGWGGNAPLKNTVQHNSCFSLVV